MDKIRDRFCLDHNPSVLSFKEPLKFISGRDDSLPIGDIYLCSYYIKKEAAEKRVHSKDYEAMLIAHGVLHILGYDHSTNENARKMEAIEKKVFK